MKAGLLSPEREQMARQTAELLALLAATASLAQSANPEIAEAFAEGRLGGLPIRNYGNPMAAPRVERLIDRSFKAPA